MLLQDVAVNVNFAVLKNILYKPVGIMLKTIRTVLAIICFIAVSLLFIDFTATAIMGWGWLAKWQFMPALLAMNIPVLVVLVLLTLLLGRVYCSVLCPLGVLQDIVSHVRGWFGKKQRRRFSYRKPLTWLRVGFLAIFALLVIFGLVRFASVIEPYSEFGRIMSSLVKPLYVDANNLIAASQDADSYTFYHVDYYVSATMVIIAVVTLLVVGGMAWIDGRIYCNTVCPVGTILGYLSRYSWLKPVIDESKCVKCGLCAKECKASCIDSKEGKIDYTRCVACMDCIGNCNTGAISYSHRSKSRNVDGDRRKFLTVSALLAGSAVAHAQEKTVDGGLATIIDKKKPVRRTRITPPGSRSHDNFTKHCTACQLCITNCPNNVLRPSGELSTFMQPEVSYERGYCRPECTDCSSVCPAGAILPIDKAEKSSVQVGHAVWIRENCLPATEGVACGNCARHCPVGAITMIPSVAGDENSPLVPAVNTERCIGCGACENLCPVRPFSAIYVEGHEIHRTV